MPILVFGLVLGTSPPESSVPGHAEDSRGDDDLASEFDGEAVSRGQPEDERNERVMEARQKRLEAAYQQRMLGAHPLVQARLTPFSLPASYLKLGGGLAGVTVDAQSRGDGTGGRSYYLAGAGELQGGVAIGKWVGLQGAFDGLAGAGGTAESVADAGANVGFAWEVAPLVRVLHHENKSFGVGGEVRGAFSRGLVLRPAFDYLDELVAEIAANEDEAMNVDIGPENLEEFFKRSIIKTDTIGGGGVVAYAQSFGPFFAIQAGVRAGYQRTRSRVRQESGDVELIGTSAYVNPSVALGVDAGKVPFYAMLEYGPEITIPTGDAAGDPVGAHDLGLGLFYNGLTVTAGPEIVAQISDGRVAVITLLSLTAYF